MIYFFTNVILTDNPQFYGLGETLSNILVIGLFHSDNRMVVFFKTKKIHITANMWMV